MDKQSKPSLSQQLLRTLRPRVPSSTTTASSLVTSGSSSPSIAAVDFGSAVSTPDVAFDVLYAKTAGPYAQRSLQSQPLDPAQAVGGHASSSAATSSASSPLSKSRQSNDAIASISARQPAALSRSDYVVVIQELQKTFKSIASSSSSPSDAAGAITAHYSSEDAVQRDMQCLRILISALKRTTDAEQGAADQGDEWDESHTSHQGPPQSEVFKLCLLLLSQAGEEHMPLPIRLGACELLTVSVQLSDLRSARTIKAVRETRSGAPGSQSSKAADADQPLANVDRAALYSLVRSLSGSGESHVSTTKDRSFESLLPAFPMQLRAFDVLSQQGRDVASFPGILDFLSEALETVWQELQTLRVRAHKSAEENQEQSATQIEARNVEHTVITEELSLREWSVLSAISLITSIIKFSFAKVEIKHIEYVLECLAHVMCYAPPIDNNKNRRDTSAHRRRARSKERKPLTEGYDYYGLDAINSDQSTPAPTPRASQTPRLGPRIIHESAGDVAPIALATLAPAAFANSNEEAQLVAPILHETEVAAVCKLVDSVLRFGFMPPASVGDVCKLFCAILGHRPPSAVGPLDNVQSPEGKQGSLARDFAWHEHVKPVISNLLRSHCANAALRYVRNMLIERQADESTGALCGAVEFLRFALSMTTEAERSGEQAGKRTQDDALTPTLSIPLLMPALAGALRRHNDLLDVRVIDLVSELLPLEDSAALPSSASNFEDWEMLLTLPGTAKRHLEDWHFKYGDSPLSSSTNIKISAVALEMAKLIGRLRVESPSSEDDDSSKEHAKLPWTPRLAKLFLSMAPILSQEKAKMLIQYYKANHLCLPCTHDWLGNIQALLGAFFSKAPASDGLQLALGEAKSQADGESPRTSVAQLIFDHVYGTVHELPAYRKQLLQDVLLPIAGSSLAAEADAKIEALLRRVIVEAAVTSATNAPSVGEAVEGDEHDAGGDGKIFNDVISLHVAIASEVYQTSQRSLFRGRANTGGAHITFADPPGSHEHKQGSHSHGRSSSFGQSSRPMASSENAQHLRAVRSALDLIAIFHRLAFSSPWVLVPTSSRQRLSEEAQRAAWERQARNACLYIFRVLLQVIRPSEHTNASDDKNVPAQHSAPLQVRLVILQWLVRLRTDGEHRVYIAGDINDLLAPAAESVSRGPASAQNSSEAATQAPDSSTRDRSRSRASNVPSSDVGSDARDDARRRTPAERSASRVRDASRERGRREPSAERNDRIRSQSRQRPPASGLNKRTYLGDPLWRIPEVLAFEVPPLGWRSDVVFTYMHTGAEGENECHHEHHHSHAQAHRSGENPTPLPISEYLSMCNALLAGEQEWELTSYLLCCLPHQLANKHLICGPKAQVQIVALRQLLVSGILDQQFLNQVTLPDDVKKSDVYALSYGSLATLVSYRSLFSRSQQDEIVEAFMLGLNKSSNTAQPCIRALSVACYELQKSINRHLPKMLVKLSTVMSSSAMSVHILELIASIGHLSNLYANFTETEYRRIFGIALQYIQYHHQRHSEEDMRSSATAFTLSQYVIMLAYYNISLWFMIVKIQDRQKYVEAIRKGLLIANEGRTKVADQTEVCFDFLARFTHSNADARPQKSLLNRVVRAKGVSVIAGGGAVKDAGILSKSYMHGNAMFTVTALEKPGWAEILIRRPSGTAGLLCKLENVIVSELPEEDGEYLHRPAIYMADRQQVSTEHKPTPAEWARQSLFESNEKLSRRPLGPTGAAQVTRPRAKSQTSSDLAHVPIKFLRRREPDAYSSTNANDVDSNDTVVEPGSQEVQDIMSKVLVEGRENTANAQGADQKQKSSNTTQAAKLQSVARQETIFNPSFLALQLSSFPDTSANSKPPTLLPDEKWVERTVRAIDLTPVVDFHKIGVLYVGAGQCEEREILGNRTGSRRYAQFLTGLGDLVTLRNQQDVYTGGLDIHNDEHGRYAYVWGDDISQIVFHTTTLMPNQEEHDPNHSRKKALIGNDWVRIVWNESGREYSFDTIKTQFNFINIVISPNSRGGVELGSINSSDEIFYRVSLQRIDGLPNFSPVGDGQLVSAAALANFVRILALNCSLVSQIYVSTSGREAGQAFTYTSNWVSRLQHLVRARSRLQAESMANDNGSAPSQNGEQSNDMPKSETPISVAATTSYDIARF